MFILKEEGHPVTIWIGLEDTVVSEISQSHKNIRHHSPYISGMQFTETESRTAIAGVGGLGELLSGSRAAGWQGSKRYGDGWW